MDVPHFIQRRLESAQGYLDLGMPAEAWAELDFLDAPARHHAAVRLARIDIRMRQARWEDACALAEALIADEPSQLGAYISRSFCLHCLHRTEEARDKLKQAPPEIENIPTYYYNLGCYECQLGRVEHARAYLKRAFRLLPAFRQLAVDDPDLRPLRQELDSIADQAIRDEPAPAAPDIEKWARQLDTGDSKAKEKAMAKLVALKAESVFTARLSSVDPALVDLAVKGLWECWYNEAGEGNRWALESGIEAMNSGALDQAEAVFTELARAHPNWPEAANKLATVLYMKGHFERSLALCRRVVAAKPNHFGAWSGLAMCAIQIEDWAAALEAARHAFRLQPSSSVNRTMLDLIENKMRTED
jgi:tetratricopeptide (TPR) repeat protein